MNDLHPRNPLGSAALTDAHDPGRGVLAGDLIDSCRRPMTGGDHVPHHHHAEVAKEKEGNDLTTVPGTVRETESVRSSVVVMSSATGTVTETVIVAGDSVGSTTSGATNSSADPALHYVDA